MGMDVTANDGLMPNIAIAEKEHVQVPMVLAEGVHQQSHASRQETLAAAKVVVARRVPAKGRIVSKAPKVAAPMRMGSCDIRLSIGHTLSPVEQGMKVIVQGDGWGGGQGSYTATVTEADAQTFTVVRDGVWEETHVLRA